MGFFVAGADSILFVEARAPYTQYPVSVQASLSSGYRLGVDRSSAQLSVLCTPQELYLLSCTIQVACRMMMILEVLAQMGLLFLGVT